MKNSSVVSRVQFFDTPVECSGYHRNRKDKTFTGWGRIVFDRVTNQCNIYCSFHQASLTEDKFYRIT